MRRRSKSFILLNAAIRSVVRYGLHHKLELEVTGIHRVYAGLIDEELKPLDHRSVDKI